MYMGCLLHIVMTHTRQKNLQDKNNSHKLPIIITGISGLMQSLICLPTPQKGSMTHFASATSFRNVRPRKHESNPMARGHNICPRSNTSGEAKAPLRSKLGRSIIATSVWGMIQVGRLVLPPVGHGSLAEAKQVRIKGSAKTLRISKRIAGRKQGHFWDCAEELYSGQRVQVCGHGDLTWRAVAPWDSNTILCHISVQPVLSAAVQSKWLLSTHSVICELPNITLISDLRG